MNSLEKKVEAVLETYVRPTLFEHHGNIEILLLNKNTLYLKMLGQCRHCPNAQTDTKHFIQTVFQQHLPEIRQIEIDDSVDENLLDLTYQILNHTI